jgi:DegV family protein with EDD domain
MLDEIKRTAYNREVELRERMFRMVLMTGCVVVIAGIVEWIVLMRMDILLVPLLTVFVLMLLAAAVTRRYHKIELASMLVGGFVIFLLFPCKFVLCGGIDGGGAVWFVLGFIYIFIMFYGKRLAFFVVSTVLIDLGTYLYCFYHPSAVRGLHSDTAVYLDSVFAVVVVGIAVGAIIKYQIQVLEEERSVTQKQKEELEEVSRSKDAFFANMSHEIRTPINTIIGLNEIILRQEIPDVTRECAQNIRTASNLLLNLVNDILDFSQIEIKRMKITPAEYEISNMIQELVNLVQVRMREKKLDFLLDIDPKIPTVLYGDQKRITQILLNILTNAVKYTSEGSVTFSIHVESKNDNRVILKFSVEDTGIGIRKEDMGYLYDAFRRVDDKNNLHTEGSGLGLAITKQLVELMGGEITVDSIYTKGSTFTVTLEQQILDSTPIRTTDFFKGAAENNVYEYRRRFEAPEGCILIVDDNEMSAIVTKRLLEPTKLQIDIAKDGKECLQKTKQKYYHTILMDYMLPGMNGAEVLNEIRKQENGLCRESPVLLLTAKSSSETQELSGTSGFDGYLEKPVQGTRLEEELYRFLPEEIIEYRGKVMDESAKGREFKRTSKRKRKKVYITTDCVSDLPEQMIEKYDIKIMYLYIKTDTGRFADTREIDSDTLTQYMDHAVADAVSVEEYEAFFAEALVEAEYVIHISMAEAFGQTYKVAAAAAQGFDHVKVIDSGQISGGQGLIVLYAAKLARERCSYNEIVEAIERIKGQLKCSFIMPDANAFYRNGHTGRFMAKLCETLRLHPVFVARQSVIKIQGIRVGKLESAWKRYIRYHLSKKREIDTDVIFITYIGCTVKQVNYIKEEIHKVIPFEKMIVQKGSCCSACNSGIGTIGIAYYLKG